MRHLLLALFLICSLTACSDDLRFVVIQYEGYALPKGISVWLQNGSDKIKIMSGQNYAWSGYFRDNDEFVIAVVKNNKLVNVIGYIRINGIDPKLLCNAQLTFCERRY